MKRSVNFGSMKVWRRGNEAKNLIATCSALGMTEDEIVDMLKQMKKEQGGKEPTP